MTQFEVCDDGIYQVLPAATDASDDKLMRLVIPKETLVEAMKEWFGIPVKYCENYKNGICQRWGGYAKCGGLTRECQYCNWPNVD